MAFDIVGVVQSEIRRPIAWLGQAQDGPQKRRIISPHFQWGDFHFRPVGQFGLGRQHHHAVLDCAFEAHADCLTQDARQRKPSRNQGWQKRGPAKYAEQVEEGRPPRLLSAYSAFRGEPLPLLPATCPVVSSAVKVPAMIYLDHDATTPVLPGVLRMKLPPNTVTFSYTIARQAEKRMKFELYKDVVLARDLPEYRLKRGDIMKPVEHHLAPDGTEGYSAEVFNALGDTLTIITVPDSALEPLREDEVLCARVLAAA